MKFAILKAVCTFAAFSISLVNQAKGQATDATSFSTQHNKDIGISCLVPNVWFFGTLVPEPPNPKDIFTRIDVVIASGMPPPERSHIPKPIAVHISRFNPKEATDKKQPSLLATCFANDNIAPNHQTINGFTFSKFGPYITKQNPRWTYQIVITNHHGDIYCVISTSADADRLDHQRILMTIADSIKPNLQ